MSAEWPPTDDPLFDPNDPAAVEREERRREREAKRREREAKRGKKEAPAPPPEKPAPPPAPPRTPEQEFWNEDPEPAPPVPGQEPVAPAARQPDAPDPGMVERGRRRLLGRRRSKEPAPEPPPAPKAPPARPAGTGADAPPPPATPPPKAPPTAPPAAKSANGPAADAGEPAPKAAAAEPRTEVHPQSTPKPVPPQASATPPEGDPLRPLVGGAAAGAAAGGAAAAGASASGSAGSGPPRGGNQPPTGEHQPMTDQPPTEEPNTGDWQPLERDWDFHDEGDPEMAGAARAGRRRGEDGGNRRGGIAGALLRHPFRIVAVIVLIVVLWFLNGLFQPFHGDGHGHVKVTIPKGAGVGEVADILEKRGVIDGSTLVNASTLFQIRVTLDGKRGDLFAGHFNLQKGMSYSAAIDALSKEPSASSKPGITTVTIPEGYSRPQAAELVEEDGIPGSYTKATVKSKYLKPAEYGGKGAKNLEGFLFPDTFELKPNVPVKSLVQKQLEDFKRKIKQVNMKYANSKNLTIYDVLTIGSMVEREAGVPKQRKLVASVIYNRLHEGMPLGIDATIRFATGNYENPLTQTQLETSSAYNTRTNVGLPPGPINSPGLAAIQAAAHPAKTGYLFYVNNPNSCNELSFSKTEEEFEANVQKYEAAREKAGGNAPSTCGE
jgi:UPF0755 protein